MSLDHRDKPHIINHLTHNDGITKKLQYDIDINHTHIPPQFRRRIPIRSSRDRTILHRDVRMPDQYLRKLVCHKQEVCGLRWNDQEGQLASGGNDNRVVVWDKLEAEPLYRWGGGGSGGGISGGHTAAVKALGWSPHQRGLLASGGGTADRTIKFWNTHISPQASSSISASAGATISNPAATSSTSEVMDTSSRSGSAHAPRPTPQDR